jgi:superfamily I DNA and/or RNA helicase
MNESKSITHLNQLKKLLSIEQEEDYRLFKEEFLRADINKRRENGFTWYPIVINSEEPSGSKHVMIELERTTYLDKSHQFGAGKNVSLFSNKNNELIEIGGTIKSVYRNSIKLIVNADELPDWVYDGKLGLNLQFDSTSYQEMFFALEKLIKAKDNRVEELREMIYGNEQANFFPKDDNIILPHLNLSQNRAVRHVLAAKDIAIIHGPPGTGKTTTLVQAIRLTTQTEKQVLVCAPTNTAVDLLTEKLLEEGILVLRIGHPARVSDDLLKTTIDGKIINSSYYKDIKSLRKTAEEYFKMASKYKRTFGKEEAEQRSMYYNEAKRCVKEADLLEDYIIDEALNTAQVITCTPVNASSKFLRNKKFSTLFFDEASQALDPMLWIPLLKSNRIILAGDHFQLPPVVKSREAEQGGLKQTVLDRMMKQTELSVLLTIQYRMHNAIMHFSNKVFYNNELSADVSVKETSILSDENAPLLYKAIQFIDTAGCGFEELQNQETLSLYNPPEANLIWKHLQIMINECQQHSINLESLSIGIIAPYKSQIETLHEQFHEIELPTSIKNNCSIKTIDGFQGEERDVIYISFVRSNDKGEIGFLSDIRRTNVALTRARKKLVMIGDSATLANHTFYKELIDYCEELGCYTSAWEFNFD